MGGCAAHATARGAPPATVCEPATPPAWSRPTEAPRPAEPPAALSALARAVERITPAGQPSHRDVSRGLSALADAIGAVARCADPCRHLRQDAELLATSPDDALTHAGFTIDGLRAADRALAAITLPTPRRAAYDQMRASFEAELDKLDRKVPMLEQQPVVRRAFVLAGDLVGLAANQQPWPTTLELPDRAFAQHVDIARGLIADSAAAQWDRARQLDGAALLSLADAIDSWPGASPAARAAAQQVRERGERLRDVTMPQMEISGVVKHGLFFALDALVDLRNGADGTWAESARQATASIDERLGVVFQRAALQDALRATADAYAITAKRGQICAFVP